MAENDGKPSRHPSPSIQQESSKHADQGLRCKASQPPALRPFRWAVFRHFPPQDRDLTVAGRRRYPAPSLQVHRIRTSDTSPLGCQPARQPPWRWLILSAFARYALSSRASRSMVWATTPSAGSRFDRLPTDSMAASPARRAGSPAVPTEPHSAGRADPCQPRFDRENASKRHGSRLVHRLSPKKHPERPVAAPADIPTWGNALTGTARNLATHAQDAISAVSIRCPCQTAIDATNYLLISPSSGAAGGLPPSDGRDLLQRRRNLARQTDLAYVNPGSP